MYQKPENPALWGSEGAGCDVVGGGLDLAPPSDICEKELLSDSEFCRISRGYVPREHNLCESCGEGEMKTI